MLVRKAVAAPVAATARGALAVQRRTLVRVGATPASDIELEFLGTSSGMPTMRRNTSCVALKHRAPPGLGIAVLTLA